MKKHIFTLALTMLSVQGICQVQVLAGTSLIIASGTSLSSPTGLNIQTGGVAVINGTLDLKQDINIDGTLTVGGAGIVTFSGSVAQQISAISPINIPTLQVNNASGLTLWIPVTVSNQLQLIAGNLNTSTTNPLHLNASATNPIEIAGSRIIGTAIMDNRMIGTGPLNKFLDVQLSAGTDLGAVMVTRTTGSTATINVGSFTSINANWNIFTSAAPATTDRQASFYWLSVNDNGKNLSAIDLWAAAPPATFTKVNTLSEDVSGSDPRIFIQNNISQLNRVFTVTDNASPLPLTLLSFDAALQKDKSVLLRWVCTDMAAEDIALERAPDGATFQPIAVFTRVPEPGNEYHYQDTSAFNENEFAFYRLKLQDKSGNYSYSDIRVLHLGSTISKFCIAPMPFKDQLTISGLSGKTASARLIDGLGHILADFQNLTVNAGSIFLSGLENLPSGHYYLQAQDQGKVESFTIVKIE